LTAALVFALAWAASHGWSQPAERFEPTELTYPQLYTGPDGETHFRDVRVPLTPLASAPPAPAYFQSSPQAATATKHVVFPPHWGANDREEKTFHNASAKRFILFRRGAMWFRASDGETREFGAGDVLEVLDVAPSKGHISWTGDAGAQALFADHP
jgi:hypothetical protein